MATVLLERKIAKCAAVTTLANVRAVLSAWLVGPQTTFSLDVPLGTLGTQADRSGRQGPHVPNNHQSQFGICGSPVTRFCAIAVSVDTMGNDVRFRPDRYDFAKQPT